MGKHKLFAMLFGLLAVWNAYYGLEIVVFQQLDQVPQFRYWYVGTLGVCVLAALYATFIWRVGENYARTIVRGAMLVTTGVGILVAITIFWIEVIIMTALLVVATMVYLFRKRYPTAHYI